ncbi:MAG: PIG-L deacetylase family protein [Pelotomaculum sp.]
MKRQIIVISPHPDDETLGCGGNLLRHRAEGDALGWLIVTAIHQEEGFTANQIAKRQQEISTVAQHYGFASVVKLDLPTTKLDTVPMQVLVHGIGSVFQEIKPDTIYLPYRGDAHTDHAIVFDAAISCTKWFRYPFIKRVLVYETLSETDFGLNPDANGFRPNVFVNIDSYLEQKIHIMREYSNEMGEFPFPRSEEAIRALARIRGIAAGYQAAEAFMLLRERWD